ncbi:hypothetical protein YPPY32_1880, partial [Yersinia pestis PY-32]
MITQQLAQAAGGG